MPRPNFVIIGAARSGTTSLYRYLAQHPHVFTSAVKETNYFAWVAEGPFNGPSPMVEQMFPIRSAEAYDSLFADAADRAAIVEASPRYLHVPGVPERLAAELPDVRLIAILRDPAQRAYADYLVRRRRGIETRSFEAVIDAEGPHMHEPPGPGTRPILHHGLYHAHLRRWLAVVPRDRLLVLLHDDLVADPAGCFAALCRFLGIANIATKDQSVRHGPAGLYRSAAVDQVINGRVAKTAGSVLPTALRAPVSRLIRWVRRKNTRRPEMPSVLHFRLASLYCDDILPLGDLLERDLGQWLLNASAVIGRGREPSQHVGEARI